jgi:class 3 adenylate cyclase
MQGLFAPLHPPSPQQPHHHHHHHHHHHRQPSAGGGAAAVISAGSSGADGSQQHPHGPSGSGSGAPGITPPQPPGGSSGGSSGSGHVTTAALLASSLASAASFFLPPWAEPGPGRGRRAWLAAAGKGREEEEMEGEEEGGDPRRRTHHHERRRQHGGWAYPSPRLLYQALLRRHGGRVPPAQHPLQQLPASRFVQRKFCTVLIAKAVRGSHLGVAPARLAAALGEFDRAAAQHRVARISNTGSTYVAACGLFDDTWGSARRDALAAVAMASDLVAIAEALGLELCVGLTSGSVVGTLEPVSHAFYDLVGDVVNAVTLLAELAQAGQVFLGDSTYQLLAQRESSLHFRVPRVATHAVRVRLLSGGEEAVQALSNPYAASWWHEHRQAEVLQALQEWEEGQRGRPVSLRGEDAEDAEGGEDEDEKEAAAVRGMEEGRAAAGLGEGIELQAQQQQEQGRRGRLRQRQRQRQQQQQQDREHQHRLFFSLADVYELRGRLEGEGEGGKWERYPRALATVDHNSNSNSNRGSGTDAGMWTEAGRETGGRRSCAGRGRALAACSLDGGPLLADLALPPRVELELLVAGVTLAVLVWSIHLPPWVLAGLLALIAAQAFLRWRPLPRRHGAVRSSSGASSSSSSTRVAMILLLYYLLCAAVILALPLDTDSYPLTLLRVMFLLVPALHLPTAPSAALTVEVYAVVLISHVGHWALHATAGSSAAREMRVSGAIGARRRPGRTEIEGGKGNRRVVMAFGIERSHIITTCAHVYHQYLIERHVWYGGVMALLLVLRHQTERLLHALPAVVYPQLHLLQELSGNLRARTDAVVAALVPSHLDVRRLLQQAQRQTRYGSVHEASAGVKTRGIWG